MLISQEVAGGGALPTSVPSRHFLMYVDILGLAWEQALSL